MSQPSSQSDESREVADSSLDAAGYLVSHASRLSPADVCKRLSEGKIADLHQAFPGLRFRADSLPARLVVKGTLSEGYSVYAAVRKGRALHRVEVGATSVILGHTWQPISESDMQAVGGFIARARVDVDATLDFAAYLRLLSDAASDLVLVDETSSVAHDQTGDPSSAIQPPGLTIDLFPYQKAGLAFLLARSRCDVGALLADEMGLGKTAQAIALILAERDRGTSLVIAPAALLPNWAREIGSFAPSLSVYVHQGAGRTGSPRTMAKADVVMVSYETLSADIYLFRAVRWNVVVADEAQRLRNPDSLRARSARSVPSRARVAVTGTPVENSLMDTWSIAEFILAGFLDDREVFLQAFPDEPRAAVHLGRLLKAVSIRRTVASVAQDLPAIVQIERFIAMEDGDRRDYQRVAASGAPFGATTERLEVCAHATDACAETAHFGERPKVAETMALLDDIFARGERALIFACYLKSLDRLAAVIRSRWPQAFVATVDGRLAPPARQGTIDQFSCTAHAGCLLLNPTAAGVGLNITAANHVIHFTPNWNPAVTDQATARAYRRGQSKKVVVYHMAYADSVDEEALARGDWKRDLAAGLDDGLAP